MKQINLCVYPVILLFLITQVRLQSWSTKLLPRMRNHPTNLSLSLSLSLSFSLSLTHTHTNTHNTQTLHTQPIPPPPPPPRPSPPPPPPHTNTLCEQKHRGRQKVQPTRKNRVTGFFFSKPLVLWLFLCPFELSQR